MGLAAIFNGRANPTLKDCYVLLGRNIDRFNLLPSIFSFGLEIFISFITGLFLKFLNLSSLRSIPAVQITQLIVQGFDHGRDRGWNISGSNINSCWINSFGLAPNDFMQTHGVP